MDTAGLSSTATGEIERGGESSILRRIHVRYSLPAGLQAERARIDRVMEFHARHCGVYRSLHPQIEIATELAWAPE